MVYKDPEYMKKYKLLHREEFRERCKKYYQEHKEKLKLQAKLYRQNHMTNIICETCGERKSVFITKGTPEKLGYGRFCSKSCAASLEHNSSWSGGISFEPYCQLFNDDLRKRVRAYFNNQCILCGKKEEDNVTKNGNNWNLSVHHVEYNKMACCDGKQVHFAALCISCHTATNNSRDRWEAMLHRIIDEIYEGRSYYTRDEYKELLKCPNV